MFMRTSILLTLAALLWLAPASALLAQNADFHVVPLPKRVKATQA